MIRMVTAIAIFLALSINALAQVTSGEVLGTIRDGSGAIVPNAKVSVKNLDTNANREVSSDTEGRFRIPTLPTGQYELTVVASGFATYKQGPITLRLNQSAEFDVRLTVSSVNETIAVSADAPLVNTTNAEVGALLLRVSATMTGSLSSTSPSPRRSRARSNLTVRSPAQSPSSQVTPSSRVSVSRDAALTLSAT